MQAAPLLMPAHICAGTGPMPAHICAGTRLKTAHICAGTGCRCGMEIVELRNINKQLVADKIELQVRTGPAGALAEMVWRLLRQPCYRCKYYKHCKGPPRQRRRLRLLVCLCADASEWP